MYAILQLVSAFLSPSGLLMKSGWVQQKKTTRNKTRMSCYNNAWPKMENPRKNSLVLGETDKFQFLKVIKQDRCGDVHQETLRHDKYSSKYYDFKTSICPLPLYNFLLWLSWHSQITPVVNFRSIPEALLPFSTIVSTVIYQYLFSTYKIRK